MMRARHHVYTAGALVLCVSLLGPLGLAPAAVAQNIWDETTAALSQPAEMPEGWQFEDDLFALLDLGEALFEAKFTALDGAGRPNATQAACPTAPQAADASLQSHLWSRCQRLFILSQCANLGRCRRLRHQCFHLIGVRQRGL